MSKHINWPEIADLAAYWIGRIGGWASLIVILLTLAGPPLFGTPVRSAPNQAVLLCAIGWTAARLDRALRNVEHWTEERPR